MKTLDLRKMVMVASLALSTAFVVSSCQKEDDDMNNGTNYTVSGNASGSQMVPSVSGSGSGTLTGTFNSNTRLLTYTSTWTNLTGAPTMAGFYSGASGSAGTSIGTSWTLGSGLTTSGSFSGSTTLTADQATQLINGGLFYTYGTAAHTNGEIRGQITAVAQ